jgi:hypothetical protein
MTNIYPSDIIKRHIHARERPFIASVRNMAYGICRTRIVDSYIRHSFNTFKEGFVYLRNDIPIAFCIWKVKVTMTMQGTYTPELYIYLVCSTKQPFQMFDKILYDVEEYCYGKGIQCITLEPANEELRLYYISKGFLPTHQPQRLFKTVKTPIVFRGGRKATTQRRTRTDTIIE